MNIAAYIDHTVLKPTTVPTDIINLCKEAVDAGFAAVCVPPYYVKTAAQELAGTPVALATVVGFPFGYSTIPAKLEEVRAAVQDGAKELDVVHNIAALKAGDWAYLQAEIQQLTALVHQLGSKIKVIVESGLLSDKELLRCCEIYAPLGIDYMKTSTGYAEKGASVHAVALMRKNLPEGIHIKASGGIRNYSFAQELVAAGADRLGCSASLAILAESKQAS